MFGSPFYHETTRKIVAVFGTLFNDIHLQYRDDTDTVVQDYLVPIEFAPRDIWLARLRKESSIDSADDNDGYTRVRMTSPRMSYEFGDHQYDGEKQRNKSNKISPCNVQGTSASYQQEGVPFILPMTLNIYTTKLNDGLQIIEQILPFFCPSLTVPVKTIEDVGLVDDIKFTLESTSHEDNYEGELETKETRSVIWTLNFSATMYLYRPTNVQALINNIITNINIDDFPC